MAPVLGYWKIRSLGQPIRLLLHYVGVEFEDRLYEEGDGPDNIKESWYKEKFSHDLDFPNLPYYIDGDVRISQSNAILRYIARKHGLDGSTEAEKVRIDLITEELVDFHNSFFMTCYDPKFESLLPDYTEKTYAEVKAIEAFLGDRDWLAGDKITFADFKLYEVLDQNKILIPDVLDATPKLQAYQARFEALPAIKAYLNSDKFIKRPVNGKIATFK